MARHSASLSAVPPATGGASCAKAKPVCLVLFHRHRVGHMMLTRGHFTDCAAAYSKEPPPRLAFLGTKTPHGAAWREAKTRGVAADFDATDTRKAMALLIMAAVDEGVRDPDHLKRVALGTIDLEELKLRNAGKLMPQGSEYFTSPTCLQGRDVLWVTQRKNSSGA